MNKNPVVILVVLALVVLTSLACSIGGLTISGNKATVDITLTEDQLNQMIAKSASNTVVDGKELLTKVTKVEFYGGYLRAYGTMQNSGGDDVDGNMDLAFSTKDDVLVVKIIAVDFPGITMDDPRIVDANNEIAKSLTESVTESNGEVKFLDANVNKDGLHLKIEIQPTK